MATTAKKTTEKKTTTKKTKETSEEMMISTKPDVVKKSQEIISEEKLLKMSEKDYMNQAQLDFFKDRLQKLREDILKNADATTENLRENILVPDPADRATIEEEHALELRTRDRERKLLKKVEQALSRIDSGEYGWCEETGEAIGVSRLLARPTANLSLEAQERRELRQKLFGD
jgi:DnaK suppressor protein